MRSKIFVFLLCLIAYALGYTTSFLQRRKPRVSVLESPLRVVNGAADFDSRDTDKYFLPPGTVMIEEDEWIPKDGYLYRIHVRVFGEPFDGKPSQQAWMIAPLTAINPPPK